VSPGGGIETAQYLGGIDPALYKTTSSSAADDDEEEDDDEGLDQAEGGRGLGSVRFGVAYERETERLTVTLVRARNLPSRNPGTGNACDPFVRLDIAAPLKELWRVRGGGWKVKIDFKKNTRHTK